MVVLALCQPFGVTQDKPYVPQGKGWGYFLFITKIYYTLELPHLIISLNDDWY